MIFFGLASVVSGLAAVGFWLASKSASIHEILAAVCGVISAVFGVGCVVAGHLHDLPDRRARAMTAARERLGATAGHPRDYVDRAQARPSTTPQQWIMVLVLAFACVAVILVVGRYLVPR